MKLVTETIEAHDVAICCGQNPPHALHVLDKSTPGLRMDKVKRLIRCCADRWMAGTAWS
jgi:hypothetical protein